MKIREDKIGFGNIVIKQYTEEFCYGVDAVLLANGPLMRNLCLDNKRIMDLGCGTGIIPLILSQCSRGSTIYGLEVQQRSYSLGLENVDSNNLGHRIKLFNGNVKTFWRDYPKLRSTFDVVTANPPYTEGSASLKSSNDAKNIARHEVLGNLEDFMVCAKELLIDKGSFFMVHKASRVVDIFEIGRRIRLEPKVLQFISGKSTQKPSLVIIKMVKNGGRELVVEEPLVIRDENGEYSKDVLASYNNFVNNLIDC